MQECGVEKKEADFNRMMARTALSAFVFTLAAFCYLLAIFAMITPKSMAKFFDSVGAENASAKYYSRIYERDQTPENLYYALYKNIAARRGKAVLKYGKEFFFKIDATDRERIIDEVNAAMIAGNSDAALAVVIAKFDTDFYLRYWFIIFLRAENENELIGQVFSGARNAEVLNAELDKYLA